MKNSKKKNSKKNIMMPVFLITLSTFIFLFSAYSADAACCANPLLEDSCTDNDLSAEKFLEICCPAAADYGSENLPSSRDDCAENYFTEESCTDLKSKCDLGCCLDKETGLCSSSTARSYCTGTFSTRFGERCEKDGIYAMQVCVEGCCCTGEGFGITTIASCTSHFSSDINDISECAEHCRQLPCQDGCQREKPVFCEEGRLRHDCTGGDGISGNFNDCGCEAGYFCMENGMCMPDNLVKVLSSNLNCQENGMLSCDGACVENCDECSPNMIEEGGICVDACSDVFCGPNSLCEKGLCVCDSGYYTDTCTLFGDGVDYTSDGCRIKNPCESNNSLNVWFLLGIFLLLVLFIFLIYKKRDEYEDKYEN